MNKNKRNAACSKLLGMYKMMMPTTIADVRKKINTLWSNCRRELNKIKASKRTGTGTDNIYTPTSLVFCALSVLLDVEAPVSLRNEEKEVSTRKCLKLRRVLQWKVMMTLKLHHFLHSGSYRPKNTSHWNLLLYKINY